MEETQVEQNGKGQTATLEPTTNHGRTATLMHFVEEPEHQDIPESQEHKIEPEDEASSEALETKSPSPVWSQPQYKAAVVLGLGSIVVGALYLFVDHLNFSTKAPTTAQKLQDFPKPVTTNPAGSEEGKLKAEVALGDQVQAFNRINQKPVPGGAKLPSSGKTKTPTAPGSNPPPANSSVASPNYSSQPSSYPARPTYSYHPASSNYSEPSAPRTYSPPVSRIEPTAYRSSSNFNSPTYPTRAVSSPINSPDSTPSVDPTETWIATARLGSYGQVNSTESAESTDNSDRNNTTSDSVSSSNQSPSTSVPTVVPEESSILTGTPLKTLVIGTTAKGTLETPFTWMPGQSNHYLIRLTQPLVAGDGSQALPSGTQLETEAASVSGDGLVQMVVIAVIQPDGQEQPLSSDAVSKRAIQVFAANGRPLIAKSATPRRGGGGFNFGQALLQGSSAIMPTAFQGVSQSLGQKFSQNRSSTYEGQQGQQGAGWTINAGLAVQVFVSSTISF